MPLVDNSAEIARRGSQVFTYSVPAIAAGLTSWFDIRSLFPQSIAFLPLDSIVIQNNSANQVSFYLNTTGDVYIVPSFMIQPIQRRAVWRFGILNSGAAATNAGDIIVTLRRLPPDVQATVSVGGA